MSEKENEIRKAEQYLRLTWESLVALILSKALEGENTIPSPLSIQLCKVAYYAGVHSAIGLDIKDDKIYRSEKYIAKEIRNQGFVRMQEYLDIYEELKKELEALGYEDKFVEFIKKRLNGN